MTQEKVKVLYIAGLGRSGSTLLDSILGQIDGFFSIGEFNNVWDCGVIANRRCGCGAPFRECETWRRIFARAFGGMDEAPAREMAELRARVDRPRYVPLLFVPGLRERVLRRRMGLYLRNLEALYRAVREVTGCRLVIDSSKTPLHAYLLELTGAVDLYVVHLVRDARAVAYSWQRVRRQLDSDSYMLRVNPAKCALAWDLNQTATDLLWRRRTGCYLRIRYEDFVASPRQWLGRIVALVGEAQSRLPLVGEDCAEIKPAHGIFGNPSRFRTGLVKLSPDEEWRHQMKISHRLLVTALTFPVLARYGYPVMLPNGD
ncbi:MAG: sulfotransferase [Candidatus Binataceae bacterium]